MTMVLILIGVLVVSAIFWMILSGKGQDQEKIDDRYNCHVCDDRDCECHRMEDPENTSQNASDES